MRKAIIRAVLFLLPFGAAVAGGPHCGPGYCFTGDTCTPCGIHGVTADTTP